MPIVDTAISYSVEQIANMITILVTTLLLYYNLNKQNLETFPVSVSQSTIFIIPNLHAKIISPLS